METMTREELHEHVFYCPNHGKKRVKTRIRSGSAMYQPLHYDGFCQKCDGYTVDIGVEIEIDGGIIALNTRPSTSLARHDVERKRTILRNNRVLFVVMNAGYVMACFSPLLLPGTTIHDIFPSIGRFVTLLLFSFFLVKDKIFPKDARGRD